MSEKATENKVYCICPIDQGIAMCFLIEPVYCMTPFWTLHRAHNKWKSPIAEDNIWATVKDASEPVGFLP